jgi:chaperonin cofactor prefoldin
MKRSGPINFSDDSSVFTKIIDELRNKVLAVDKDLRKLNDDIKPIRNQIDVYESQLQKLKALIEPSISISVIEKPKEYDESKKPLDTHLRGRVRFVINGETINIPVYIGDLEKLKQELQKINGNKKAIDTESREWTHFIRQIALEKSFKRLSTLKPGIFTAYQY